MDRSANQSRLSRAQLPPQEAGNIALSLDQLTDLDQAISLSRADRSGPPSRPTPVVTHAAPPATSSQPAIKTPAELASPSSLIRPPEPSISADPVRPAESPSPSELIRSSEPTPPPAPTPVRSAKEAINAMYSGDNPARLSDYLGTSAKDIINASARSNASNYDTKSASSLHHASNQRRMEASRPSASAIFRAAKSETTVVHTSLELDPKSPRRIKTTKSPKSASTEISSSSRPKTSPIVINSRSRAENSRATASRTSTSVRPKKGQIKITTPSPTAVAVSTIEQAAGAITAAKTTTPTKATTPAATIVDNKTSSTKSAPAKISPQIPRPSHARAVDGFAHPVQTPRLASQAPRHPKLAKTAIPETNNRSRAKSAANAAKADGSLPADSVKRRFRLAPKGFAASKPEQARPARRKFMSFINPDYSVPIPKPTPAVEIYGLTEPTPDPGLNKDGLGVVEDYRPINSTNPAMGTAASDRAAPEEISFETIDTTYESSPTSKPPAISQKSAPKGASSAPENNHYAPDNNRYALGGQSPFFLKSVSVEKRPLSDAPTRRADTISPIYTDPGDELPRKNIYDGKAPKSQKPAKLSKKSSPRDLPQRPTVIIPSSRRSHTPLFLLLILTVILGAAVGAAVYFFFFQ